MTLQGRWWKGEASTVQTHSSSTRLVCSQSKLVPSVSLFPLLQVEIQATPPWTDVMIRGGDAGTENRAGHVGISQKVLAIATNVSSSMTEIEQA